LSTLEKLTKKSVNKVSTTQFVNWLDSYLEIKKDITARIHAARAKDYVNPFRKMAYESEEEMNAIVGSLKDNSFIKEQNNALSQLEIEIAALKKELKAK
jgi:predicted neuraminidase